MHAEEAYRQKQNRAAVEAAAKEATQTAEEARVMSVKQKRKKKRKPKPGPARPEPAPTPKPKAGVVPKPSRLVLRPRKLAPRPNKPKLKLSA